MTDKMREEFEAWAIEDAVSTGRTLSFERGGEWYLGKDHQAMNLGWAAWQASRETLVIELPPEPTVPDEPEEAIDDSFMDGYYAAQGMRNACAQNIKAAGLKVTP
jgi:hypothetical protein